MIYVGQMVIFFLYDFHPVCDIDCNEIEAHL